MQILITKDSSTKIPREVADHDEARGYAAQGFHVEVQNEDGSWTPLDQPQAQPPADDAHVAVGSTRFSDGQKQTKASLAAAKKAKPAAKAAPAKKRAR